MKKYYFINENGDKILGRKSTSPTKDYKYGIVFKDKETGIETLSTCSGTLAGVEKIYNQDINCSLINRYDIRIAELIKEER